MFPRQAGLLSACLVAQAAAAYSQCRVAALPLCGGQLSKMRHVRRLGARCCASDLSWCLGNCCCPAQLRSCEVLYASCFLDFAVAAYILVKLHWHSQTWQTRTIHIVLPAQGTIACMGELGVQVAALLHRFPSYLSTSCLIKYAHAPKRSASATGLSSTCHVPLLMPVVVQSIGKLRNTTLQGNCIHARQIACAGRLQARASTLMMEACSQE